MIKNIKNNKYYKNSTEYIPQLIVIWGVTPFILFILWLSIPTIYQNNPYIYLLLFGLIFLTLNLYN